MQFLQKDTEPLFNQDQELVITNTNPDNLPRTLEIFVLDNNQELVLNILSQNKDQGYQISYNVPEDQNDVRQTVSNIVESLVAVEEAIIIKTAAGSEATFFKLSLIKYNIHISLKAALDTNTTEVVVRLPRAREGERPVGQSANARSGRPEAPSRSTSRSQWPDGARGGPLAAHFPGNTNI